MNGSYAQDGYFYSAQKLFGGERGLHFHDSYELIYSELGNVKVTVNKTQEILSAGELILIPPYMAHGYIVDGEAVAWLIRFSSDFIESFAKDHKNSYFSKCSLEPQIEKILAKYLFSLEQAEHYMVTSCLYMVCNECAKNADERLQDAGVEFRGRVIEHVTQNIGRDISMRELADELGYEYHYLSFLFNECFGMNFKSFVNALRYEAACRLLSDRNKDVNQISDECGFGSVRSFNRIFKQMSGLTPREYRKSEQK